MRTETENLETTLAVRENDVATLKKEKEILKMEKEHLERRVDEVFHYFICSSYLIFLMYTISKDHLLFKLLERCQNISVEEYDRMREDVQQMQVIYVFFSFTPLKFIHVLVYHF